MAISIDLIKKLREETKVGIADVKRALEQNGGDLEKAKVWLSEQGISKAAKKADRETGEGVVVSYIHAGGRIGALVKIGCETDFVANNEDFLSLAKEIAMQVASMDPENVAELEKQSYIRDPKKTIEDLVKEAIAKIGENIKILEFNRMEI